MAFLKFTLDKDQKPYDIMNLQEVGTLDGELVEEVMAELNSQDPTLQYKYVISEGGGKMKLRTATIYRSSHLLL